MSLNSYVLTSLQLVLGLDLPASTSLLRMLDPAINYKNPVRLGFQVLIQIPANSLACSWGIAQPSSQSTHCIVRPTRREHQNVSTPEKEFTLRFGLSLVLSEDDIPDDNIHCSTSLECVLFISLSKLRLGRTKSNLKFC